MSAARVRMYCTAACPFCHAAERLLLQKGAQIDKVRVDLEPARRAEMTQRSGGRRTVPQIWIGARHIGGCDDLYDLDRQGGLDPLLKANA
ncbi:MAG TPA: glutaredoxin 3 [Burkholderiales bacterium]|nr:glutaredoxin 3 [Burkholderiales bacterium]